MIELLRYFRIMFNSIVSRYINNDYINKHNDILTPDDYTPVAINQYALQPYEHRTIPSLRARSTAQPSSFP